MAYADLDERAIDALREFNEEGALTVLQQFKESDLSHVQVPAWFQSFPGVVFVYILFIVYCANFISPPPLNRIKVLSFVES